MVGSETNHSVSCKVCSYKGKYILKHLSKMQECRKLYKEKDLAALKRLSKFELDLKRRKEYDKNMRVERYQREKTSLALKYQQKRSKRTESTTYHQKDTLPVKSLKILRKKAIEQHLTVKEETSIRIANLNYWPKSMNKDFIEIQSEIDNLSEVIDEEIENAVARAKCLMFNFKNVSEIFEKLMGNIDSEWGDINEKLSDLIEEIPLMSCGMKLYGEP